MKKQGTREIKKTKKQKKNKKTKKQKRTKKKKTLQQASKTGTLLYFQIMQWKPLSTKCKII